MVANGTIITYHRATKYIYVTFSELKAKIYFPLVDGLLASVLTGILVAEKLSHHIEMGGICIYLTIGRESSRVGLEPDCNIVRIKGGPFEEKSL